MQVAIDYLTESRKVLDGNTRELEDELTNLSGALSNFDWAQDPVGREKLSELNRRLQNYVTARMTLRDHTNSELRTLGLLEGSDWYKDVYKPKLQSVMVEDSFAFLQDLRNYVSHRRPLPLSAGIRVSAEGTEQHISLDVRRLKQWEKWSAPAKRFLGTQDEKVDIHQLVIDYKAAVDEFYGWLPHAIIEALKGEIQATQSLWEERERMRRELVNRTGQRLD